MELRAHKNKTSLPLVRFISSIDRRIEMCAFYIQVKVIFNCQLNQMTYTNWNFLYHIQMWPLVCLFIFLPQSNSLNKIKSLVAMELNLLIELNCVHSFITYQTSMVLSIFLFFRFFESRAF